MLFAEATTRVSACFKKMQVYTTPDTDMRNIERLLNLPTQSMAAQRMASERPDCSVCGRRLTMLDVVTTALAVHSADFLAKAMTGKFGPIINK